MNDELRVAAGLIAAGLTIWTARPNPKWTRKSGDDVPEFHLGRRWQTNVPDPDQVRQHRSGNALCLLTGIIVDAVDVDTKNGADVRAERDALQNFGALIIGEASTPSGGAHLYVPATGIRSAARPVRGVDFRGGSADGGGRGFVFIPGTMRQKYLGARYLWTQVPDLAQAIEANPDDQSEAVWAYLVSRGITPKLGAIDTRQAQAPAEAIDIAEIPERIRDRLAALDVPDRSAHFHGTVGALKNAGYTQGQAVTLLQSWCAAVGKYADRVPAEVARSWPKLSLKAGDSGAGRQPRRDDDGPKRQLILTPAASIPPRRVRWLWQDRMAIGALSLLAGPEGLGKSTLAYWIVAQITRGTLPGEHIGKPASVIIAATEDSWAHTVVPRLIAAGADLGKVYRVEVITTQGVHASLSLPADIPATMRAAEQTGAVMLLLDPLTSRLHDSIDTHKDADTRRALEPLVAHADKHGLAVVGLMHFNKSGSTDAMTLVMASKAFTAVARSVSTVIIDPDDDTEQSRLFGTPKNNLGRIDLPVLRFTIAGHQLDTAEGPTWTGKLVWSGEAAGTISDALRRRDASSDRTATAEAADWLRDYLECEGGAADSARVKQAARKEHHSDECLRRARERIGIVVTSYGYPRKTRWELPDDSRGVSSGASRGDHITNTTTTTENSRVSPVCGVGRGGRDAGHHDCSGACPPCEVVA